MLQKGLRWTFVWTSVAGTISSGLMLFAVRYTGNMAFEPQDHAAAGLAAVIGTAMCLSILACLLRLTTVRRGHRNLSLGLSLLFFPVLIGRKVIVEVAGLDVSFAVASIAVLLTCSAFGIILSLQLAEQSDAELQRLRQQAAELGLNLNGNKG